ncbi:MAG: hypothetical protein IPK82_20660 [Polyangiaceae bacterium]|nr:hypothetical protein [Polyangiaceae bacterium]
MRFFGAMVTAGVLMWVGVAQADVPVENPTGDGWKVGVEVTGASVHTGSDGKVQADVAHTSVRTSSDGKVQADVAHTSVRTSSDGKVGVDLPSTTVWPSGEPVDTAGVADLKFHPYGVMSGPVSFGGTEFDWASVRGNVASVGLGPLAIQPRRGLWGSSYGGGAMKTVGVVLVALGGLTLFGAGVSAIVAGVEAADLNDECPNKVCVEGTRGARSLERARGAALATDWLIGIGGPVAASGTVMLIYAAALSRIGKSPYTGPVVFAGPTGGALRFQF